MTAHQNSDLPLMKAEAESWRTREREQTAVRDGRKKAKAERLAKIRREHAAMLNEPLIGADLLSQAERADIRASVISVQRWKQQY